MTFDKATDDDWLNFGVDLAWRLWSNWNVLSTAELRPLGEEQWANPVPGNNRQVRELEKQHPELRHRAEH